MPEAVYSAGGVFLEVVPSFENFHIKASAEALRWARGAGKDAGKAFDEGFREEANAKGQKSAVDAVLGPKTSADAHKAGDEAGQKFSGAFQRALRNAGKNAMANFGKDVDPELDRLRAKLKKLEDVKVGVHITEREALAELAAVQAAADKLARSSPSIEVRNNAALVATELAALQKQVDHLASGRYDVKIGVDEKVTDRALGAWETKVKSKIKAAQAAIGDIVIGVDSSEADRELAALKARLTDLNAHVGVDLDSAKAKAEIKAISLELARLSHKSVDIQVKVDAARASAELAAIDKQAHKTGNTVDGSGNAFRAFSGIVLGVVALGPAVIPVLAGIAGGLAAVGTAGFGAALGAGVAVLGLSGIQNAVSALNDVQNNATKDNLAYEKSMRTANNGVRDAEKGLSRTRESAARSAEDAARRVADAQRGVADAERQAARSAEDSARRVSDAQRSLVDAHRSAAQGIKSALEQQKQAEDTLARSQRDAQQAQEDLVAARIKAQQDLQDLQDKIAAGKLDERQALVDLFNAKVTYTSTMADGGATNLQKEEASIQLARAQLAIKNIRESNQQLAAEKKKGDKEGVNGSAAVQTAQDRLTQALQAQKKAQQDLGDAAAAVTQARVQGAQQVADAERSVSDALRDQQRAAADSARSIADSHRSVADAVRSQQQGALDGSRSISDAQQRLTDAQLAYQEALTKTGEVGSSSMQKLEQAMGQLSPAGRDFARFIFGLKDDFYKLRGIAQEGFLPGLQKGLGSLIKTYGPGLFRFVGTMSRLLGDLSGKAAAGLQTPVWREFFKVMEKFAPIFTEQFASILGNIATTIAGVMTALAPFSKDFGDALVSITGSWAKWAAGLTKDKSFKEFLGYVRKEGPKVVDFFLALVGALLNLAKALAPYADKLLGALTGFLEFIAGLDPKVLGAIALGILGIVLAAQILFAAMSLLGTIATAVGALATIFEISAGAVITAALPIIGIVALIVAGLAILGVGLYLLWTKSETFRKIVKGAWNGVKAAIGFVVDWLVNTAWPWIKKVWHNIADGFVWMGHTIKAIFHDYVRPILELFGAMVAALYDHTLRPVFGWIGEKWSWLADKIASGYNKHIKPIFQAFGGFIHDHVLPIFETAIDAIGKAWDGLKEMLKKPIEFVVNTIINGGLIDNFNKLARMFGTSEMPHVKLPASWDRADHVGSARHGQAMAPGFATGGWTGPGAKYQPAGLVHADEFVVRKESQQKMRTRFPGLLDHINTFGTLPGFSEGGLVAFGRRLQQMGYQVGENPAFGGVTPGAHMANSWHYRGGAIDVNHDQGNEKAALDAIIPMAKALGFAITWQAPGHYDHAHFDIGQWSDLYGKTTKVGGESGGQGFLSKLLGKFTSPLKWLEHKILSGVDKLTDKFGDNGFVKMLSAIPGKLVNAAKEKFSNLLGGVKDMVSGDKGGKAQDIVHAGASARGWGDGAEWAALTQIISHESSWKPTANNPTSTAYGLFQMLSETSSNPNVQTQHGLDYIKSRYGDPVRAWDFWQQHHWYADGGLVGEDGSNTSESVPTMMYDNGGYLSPGLTQVLNLTGRPEPVFTGEQWDHLSRGNGGVGGTNVSVTVPMMPTNSTPDEVAAAIVFAQRRMMRGGVYAEQIGAQR